MEKSTGYSQILKYTGIFGGVQGLNILIALVRTKLVAMILGPGGVGLIDLFNKTVRLVSDSTNLGIPMSAVREISAAYSSGDTEKTLRVISMVRTWCLLVAALGVVVCMALGPLLNMLTFTWGNHTLHFILLSPVVGLTAVAGGEMAVLKGTRQLRGLATSSVYNMLLLTVLTVPLFYFWEQKAIVPSLVIGAAIQLLLTIRFSYRHYPPRISLKRSTMGEGAGMVRLGIAFIFAGVMGSGVEFLIRTFLNVSGGLSDVGLYNAGYMLTMTYAGMVFSAMETDYFPRLSAVHGTGEELNLMVNRQIEVSMLIVSPMLVTLMVALPILIPLLYTGEFMPIVGMTQLMVVAMYLRAIELPISYITLARGDSAAYMLFETVYYVMLLVAVIIGFQAKGLRGAGYGVAITGLLQVVFIIVYTRVKYKYVVSSMVCLYTGAQMGIGCLTLVTLSFSEGLMYWFLGIVFAVISTLLSLTVLYSKTHLWQALVSKLKSKQQNH